MPTLRPSTAPSAIHHASYRGAHARGVIVVRWFNDSIPGEFDPLGRFICEAAAAEREPIDLIAVVRPLRNIPPPDHFEELMRFGAAVKGSFRTANLVFEGESGFWQTIVRSLATRLMVAIDKTGNVALHPSVDAALVNVCVRRGVDVRDVRAALEAEGVLHPAAEESGRFAKPSSMPPRAAKRA